MRDWLITGFVAGTLVSFLGSLPPGILNATMVQVALRRGRKEAQWFALACVMVEVAYSYLAVRLATSLLSLGRFAYFLELFSIVLLLAAGIYYLCRKATQTTGAVTSRPFALGVVLSVVNVVAVPFWVVYTSLLSGLGLVRLMEGWGVLLYLSGIGLGTWLALLGFAVSSQYIHRRFDLSSRLMNQVVGVLMVVMSMYQAFHVTG